MERRIILPKKGDYNVFKFEEIRNDKVGPNEVRIEVHFSGVNFADCLMRKGLYQDAPGYPFTPGYEVSGIITEVGENSSFKVGQKVMAGTLFNGYCSEIILPEGQTLALPENYSLAQGASVLVSYLTSYMVFMAQARVKSGDRILIDCATGALGSLSYEILKNYNVEMVGLTSSAHKKNLFKQKGRTLLLASELTDQKFDIILNSRGGRTISDDFNRLRPNGRLVSLGISNALNASFINKWKTLLNMPWFWIVKLINNNKGVFGLNLLKMFSYPETIEQALKGFNEFNIVPPEVTVFKAEEIGNAQRFIEEKKSMGKVLLSWRD